MKFLKVKASLIDTSRLHNAVALTRESGKMSAPVCVANIIKKATRLRIKIASERRERRQ